MMGEGYSAAKEEAIERMFSAAKSGDWAEACAAYKDLHIIIDDELEEDDMEEKDEGEGGEKGKKPLAAIIIGGPAKK